MTTVRVKIQNHTASGNRKGWSKLVTSVDTTKKDGYAFAGEFLPDNTEVDVEVGSVIVQKSPHGSVKNGWECGDCFIIDAEGGLIETTDRTFQWKRDFLSFRDHVAKTVADQQNPPGPNEEKAPEANPLAVFTDEQIQAEFVRRGLQA